MNERDHREEVFGVLVLHGPVHAERMYRGVPEHPKHPRTMFANPRCSLLSSCVRRLLMASMGGSPPSALRLWLDQKPDLGFA